MDKIRELTRKVNDLQDIVYEIGELVEEVENASEDIDYEALSPYTRDDAFLILCAFLEHSGIVSEDFKAKWNLLSESKKIFLLRIVGTSIESSLGISFSLMEANNG